MKISQVLPPERVFIGAGTKSKKRLLEQLSELLVAGEDSLDAGEVFNSLLTRERLGPTGLGHGVALPHGRLAGLQSTLAAFIHSADGVDFDAPDKQPVDLVFALAVPDQAAGDHLDLLAELAGLCRDPDRRQALREAEGADSVLAVVRAWEGRD